MKSPGDRAANRWEELAKYEIEETPSSTESPPPEPDSARDTADVGNSSPSSETSRGSLGRERNQGGLAARAGRLSTESSGGADSEEEGRPRIEKKKRWSPPPPLSSDGEERDLSQDGRRFRTDRREGFDGAAHDFVPPEDQPGESKKRLRKGDASRHCKMKGPSCERTAASDSDGSEEGSEERPRDRVCPTPAWRKTAPELSFSDSESSDESSREGFASPGGKSTAEGDPPEPRESLKQSSSLEKAAGRRLRKVGGGQPIPGHCALPLFSRAQPERERSGERNSPSEENGDVPGGLFEEYAEGVSPGWEPRAGLVGVEDPGERPDSDDGRQNSVGSGETDPGGPDRRATEPPGPLQLSDLCVSSTNYRGEDKLRLKRMITELGVKYTDDFGRCNTHLVCWSFEGGKFEKARFWGIPQVNHRWVEDCAWRREVVPVDDYCEKAGESVGPLPETQPSLSPSQPFVSSPPLPVRPGPEAAANDGVPAGKRGAVREQQESLRSSDKDDSDGLETDGDQHASGLETSDSEGGSDLLRGGAAKAARPWAPPAPPPLEDSLLNFEEWKRRNVAKNERRVPLLGSGISRDGMEADGRDDEEARRFEVSEGDEDVIEESGRLGGGRERGSRKRGTSRRYEHLGRGDDERGKRKRFRKSSLSEQLCSSSGSGDSQRNGCASDRNGSLRAEGPRPDLQTGAFSVGGMVYEERDREGGLEEEEDCVEVPGGRERRPLKRLKKLKITKEENRKEAHLHGRGEGSRPGGSGRRQGAAAAGWKEFDPKDWVDWNSGDRPQEESGLHRRGAEDNLADERVVGSFRSGWDEQAEQRSSHLERSGGAFAGRESLEGLGLTERNYHAFVGAREEGPEAAGGQFGVNGVETGERVTEQRPVSGGHVAHSQHWEGDVNLASLPSSEHPLHLPRAAETAREPSDRSDRRPRTSVGHGSQPAVKQRTLDNVWSKAGASLRDDRPPRKKRRGASEGFAGAAAAARHAQATAAGYGGATRVSHADVTRGNNAKTPPGSKTPVPARTPQQEQNGIARKLALLSPGGEVACAICWEARASAEQGVLPCGHGFCYHCVIKWAKEDVNVDVNGKPTLLSKWKAEAKCPLCKTPYDFVTKRHSPDSEGAALEDEVVQLPGGTFADLEGPTFVSAQPSAGMAEQRPGPRLPAAYSRGNRGRGISRGSSGPRVRTDGNETGGARVGAPAAGMDPWFGRFLAGQQTGAQRGAQSLRRTLPHAGPG